MKHLRDLIARLHPILQGGGPVAPQGPQADTGTMALPLMRRTPAPPLTMPLLQIACPDPTAEEMARDTHQHRAQRLVRQERWEDLSRLIRSVDQARSMTPGSMPLADLMCYGARGDVVMAAEHALQEDPPAPSAPLRAGVDALEQVLAEWPEDYVVACIVAQTHMDIGWAWRGTGWDVEISAPNRAAFRAHFDRARDIMSRYCAAGLNSPLVAATCCGLLSGQDPQARRVAQRYERLIDLNPLDARAMRAMGNHLLPRWHGSYSELELEARRTAARSTDLWGAGGYTWVMFDAIGYDDTACANLDLPFFIEGLRDILDRNPDPYTVNLLAAYCANAIGQTYSGNDEADQNRAQIAECAHWIVRDHLTELHPMIWAHAARGFDNNLRINSRHRFAASGREDAMRIITTLFSKEIAAGKQIVFTDEGPEAVLG